MKIAFFGTWEFSKNILAWILNDWSIEVWLVVSQPDKPVGRKKIITATPIKEYALKKNIEVLQPTKLKTNNELFEKLSQYDFVVVVAYWRIVPNWVLEAPKYWCINIHWSILPNYRWASPIQEAVKNWDKETWLTVMYMSEWMDEWDILAIRKVNIDKLDKTIDIFNKFEKIGPKLLIDTLKQIINWTIKWQKQDDSKATYCSKISKEDWEVNLNKDNWVDIYNKFKAYHPWPWIYSYYNDKKINFEEIELIENEAILSPLGGKLDRGNLIKNWKLVWIVASDKKIIILKQVKLEWKKSMDILSFINWNKDFLDYKF
jgi:methionyl-tRNA formyltransferase